MWCFLWGLWNLYFRGFAKQARNIIHCDAIHDSCNQLQNMYVKWTPEFLYHFQCAPVNDGVRIPRNNSTNPFVELVNHCEIAKLWRGLQKARLSSGSSETVWKPFQTLHNTIQQCQRWFCWEIKDFLNTRNLQIHDTYQNPRSALVLGMIFMT